MAATTTGGNAHGMSRQARAMRRPGKSWFRTTAAPRATLTPTTQAGTTYMTDCVND